MQGPIVVATDFSARADRAIDRAILLGRQLGRKVVLAHALDRKEAERADRADLDRRMRAVLPEGIPESAEVDFIYPEGSAPQALSQAANSCDAGLVVMAPARHNSLRDFLLGTAVDYTIRNCDQPILIVKQRPHHEYRVIVVATDYSETSAKALVTAMEWFPAAEFHLVHACHVAFESWQSADYVREDLLGQCRERMRAFVSDLALDEDRRTSLATHVDIGRAEEMVSKVAADTGAQLIVIGSHGESGFRHATIGSTANSLLTTSSHDTLMITLPDR